MAIVNDDSRVNCKLETSLTNDARVVNYDHHMFIVQATYVKPMSNTLFHAMDSACLLSLSLCVCVCVFTIKTCVKSSCKLYQLKFCEI